jgi:CheY-like chemotaxis protein
MKLTYKVLWFEDQFDEVQYDYERLQALVAEFGFIPEFTHRSSVTRQEIEELSEQLSTYNPYDLIIFDYDLGGLSEDGLSIASHLRSKIFTDMIFYSGKVPKELREMLFKNEVDGVFIVHRDNFYDDIEPIMEDHIKKMSDINNMRGVVMSETSQMDVRLREILLSQSTKIGAASLDEILVGLKNRMLKQLDEKKEKIEKITSLDEAVSNHFMTTFDQIRIALKSITGDEGNEILKDSSLVHKVQMERNKLAHRKAELTDDGRMLLLGPKEDFEYNFEEFQRMRNELLTAHNNINSLDK